MNVSLKFYMAEHRENLIYTAFPFTRYAFSYNVKPAKWEFQEAKKHFATQFLLKRYIVSSMCCIYVAVIIKFFLKKQVLSSQVLSYVE